MNETKGNQPAERLVVKEYCDAWMAGDAMAVVSMYHDDLTLTWPGLHYLAGVHEGQTASIEALLSLQALTNRVPIQIADIAAGERSVVAIAIERWTDPADESVTLDVRRALEFTVADSKLRTCRIYETDQPAIDEWIARASA